MLIYILIIVYFILPVFMLAFKDIWLEEDWQTMFLLLPFVYFCVSVCVAQHNIGCLSYSRRRYIRNTMHELLRWTIIVTMVYGWWNVYMFTVLHSLIWVWGILESTYIKSRVTFV